MKKLLALILCVAMVLSLAPMAFADDNQPRAEPDYVPAAQRWPGTAASNKAIKNAKENIEYVYGVLAADTGVFSTVKAVDGVITGIVDGIFEDLADGMKIKDFNGVADLDVIIPQSVLKDGTKADLRSLVGHEISHYMNSHIGSFAKVTHRGFAIDGVRVSAPTTLDGEYYVDLYGSLLYKGTDNKIYGLDKNFNWFVYNGTKTIKQLTEQEPERGAWTEIDDDDVEWVTDYRYDPVKYMDAFATAATKALASEKGSAALTAYVYGLYELKAISDINDDLDDLLDDVDDWEDGTAILHQYGWYEDSLDPYAFIDITNLPNAQQIAVADLPWNDEATIWSYPTWANTH